MIVVHHLAFEQKYFGKLRGAARTRQSQWQTLESNISNRLQSSHSVGQKYFMPRAAAGTY